MDINTSKNALDGTKTAENLRLAFEKEATNALRAGIYSADARNEKDFATKRILDEIRDNGTSLGELWLGYLEGAKDTAEELLDLAQLKTNVNGSAYDDMAKTANDEGFAELSEKFRMASEVQKSHGERLTERAKELTEKPVFEPNTPHVCPVCGFVTLGNALPEICPLCGAVFF